DLHGYSRRQRQMCIRDSFHTLLAEVCTGVAPEVNAKALAWGKQYENDARTLFEFTSGVNVTESPIIYRDENMRTACSPDGLC
ncbi:YqaJ viral recombinase family protein, partial [Escherichia sp. S69_ASV_4]|nr:YqaJ viral recombinase family protein [Escherichia sp. S69_ASV_4]